MGIVYFYFCAAKSFIISGYLTNGHLFPLGNGRSLLPLPRQHSCLHLHLPLSLPVPCPLPSQLEFSTPQRLSLSHFPSCLSLFAVPSCMVLFLGSALAPQKSIVPCQAACTHRGPLGRSHHAPVGRLASSARSACAMCLTFEAPWAVCGQCAHHHFMFSIGDACTCTVNSASHWGWGCLAHQCDIHRRIANNAHVQCMHTPGKSKGGPR